MAVGNRERDTIEDGAPEMQRRRREAHAGQRRGREWIVVRRAFSAKVRREHRNIVRRERSRLDRANEMLDAVDAEDTGKPAERARGRKNDRLLAIK